MAKQSITLFKVLSPYVYWTWNTGVLWWNIWDDSAHRKI